MAVTLPLFALYGVWLWADGLKGLDGSATRKTQTVNEMETFCSQFFCWHFLEKDFSKLSGEEQALSSPCQKKRSRKGKKVSRRTIKPFQAHAKRKEAERERKHRVGPSSPFKPMPKEKKQKGKESIASDHQALLSPCEKKRSRKGKEVSCRTIKPFNPSSQTITKVLTYG